jgi:Predicted metal-sulfur cluster biosynthetic enzyme
MGFEPFADMPDLSGAMSHMTTDSGQVAQAGSTLPDGCEPAGDDAIIEALRSVYDPEIPVNVFDLGLIYGLTVAVNGDVDIDMTLTAPACPVAGELPAAVADTVAQVDGVGKVSVRLVWEPRWSPERMSEDARLAIGFV